MASVQYPQVYRPDGGWVGFFVSEQAAIDWVVAQVKKGVVSGVGDDQYKVTYDRPKSPHSHSG